jgi:hypothetical protein
MVPRSLYAVARMLWHGPRALRAVVRSSRSWESRGSARSGECLPQEAVGGRLVGWGCFQPAQAQGQPGLVGQGRPRVRELVALGPSQVRGGSVVSQALLHHRDTDAAFTYEYHAWGHTWAGWGTRSHVVG